MQAQILGRFLRNESGATAIEYALLGTVIAVALAATFALFGDAVANLFGAGGTGEIINASAQRLN
jgi:Flp pilus assembly pilin Flp